jgi:hypothetical protein
MGYATGGGLTAKERAKREQVRLDAAKRFEQVLYSYPWPQGQSNR